MRVAHSFTHRAIYRAFLLLAALSLAACTGGFAIPPANTPAATSTPGESPAANNPPPPQASYAEITFEAQLPGALAGGQSLYIEFLDEVTGLALNPSRARMEAAEDQLYTVKIPVPVGSVVKYRYFRDNDPTGIEYTTGGQPVRYRLTAVDGPGVVHDLVAAWRSQPAAAVLGRIQGQVADRTNNAPVINALVTAGGATTLTSSDGSFVLEGLTPGLHNLVVYSLNGTYKPFQQGAIVASESATPAMVLLTPSPLVNVTFVTKPPEGTPENAAMRLLGNTYSLGNTFADLNGGMNVLASRAPLMRVLPDGRYTLTLQLPAGLDLRYKYSLGDGFWNAERSDASMVVRQLIIPEKDTTVQDRISSWATPNFEPITFSVAVPDNTPPDDVVSIQFNPYGWTQPIPMWRVDSTHWEYTLFAPLDSFQNASYRFCRNEQCGAADDTDSMGPEAAGKPFHPKAEAQKIEEQVSAWAWMGSTGDPVVISGGSTRKPVEGFLAGVEFSPHYAPSWLPYMGSGLRSVKEIGSSTVVLSPSWHVTYNTPPVMAPLTGKDPLWLDLTQINAEAKALRLDVVLHPTLRYSEDPAEWWKSAKRDDGWWQTWFARYTTFLIYHADLATQSGAKALIIGDDSILPALPGGTLVDGSPSNVPGDVEQRWEKLIATVRSRYQGKLMWMVNAGAPVETIPGFWKSVDMLYVQAAPPLPKAKDNAGMAEIEAGVTDLLDNHVLKMQEATNLPVVIAMRFPSVKGALDGCIGKKGQCAPGTAFEKPGAPSGLNLEPGFADQAYAASALLSAASQRSWVAGFFATGYYPPAEIKDLSYSVRGKPASDVLRYWYPQLVK